MSGLVESATAILGASERKLETVSNNVSNVATPGFKRQVSFSDVVSDRNDTTTISVQADFEQGKLVATDNPLDLAVSGNGFFQLRSGADFFYSRQGQFKLSENGTVITPQGLVLQQAGGGDLGLDSAQVEILEDGTVLEDGRPIARIALFAPPDGEPMRSVGGSLFKPMGGIEETSAAGLRQGMVESSNVTLGSEMVAMMTAVREAESGSRIMQLYDDLIGRAITTFGQGGR